ncbi:hypothetical protein M431DRAFT_495781 [Trichoderma harzianum CBS 226.95]|uniref:Uncharacterized protein n=1 Tax=Trichoderma harzianum CBS 226.95 TaxID=983964 RepID=A0A2T4A9R2_TRIHA|nr:hypothetical protein M431DRAFT_495781 [Trichoderma harzianum CBS 226.95]PTB53830.1 hypothetical protein M431DRAFT_495781 [Trichoderma harzianum CBS 226.95]
MQNRAATLKNKIENDNPRITALGPGDSLNPPIDVDISELWRSLDEDHKSDFHSKPVQLNRRPAVPDWDSMQTDFTKPFPMGAISPNASPGLYAVHQPSPAQQQQYLQQRFNMNNPRA